MAESPPAKEGSSVEESGALADSDLVEEAVQETASSEASAELPPRQITEAQCFLTVFRSGHF